MRIAMELAGTAAFAFSGSIPTFRTLDRMSFLKPVKIGSVVNLLASTAYTFKHLIVVSVSMKMCNASFETAVLTNRVDFVFQSNSTSPPPAVHPQTDADHLLWLEGKRRMAQLLGSGLQLQTSTHANTTHQCGDLKSA